VKDELECEIGSRLRSERKRLGMTESAMAELGEVSLLTQQAHESGLHTPTALYLNRIGSAGVNIRYVVDGTYSGLSATGRDWVIVTKIVGLIADWAKTRPKPPSPEVRARFAATFFDLYRATGVVDMQNYLNTLTLLAAVDQDDSPSGS